MKKIEINELLESLTGSSDRVSKKIGDELKKYFLENSDLVGKDFYEELFNKKKLILREIDNFPAPFIKSFDAYNITISEFQEVIDKKLKNEIPGKFTAFIGSLWDLYKMILNFLPFLFIPTLNNMDRNILGKYVDKELESAIKLYHELYHLNSEKHESKQRKLVNRLINVFLILDKQKVFKDKKDTVGEPFILNIIFKSDKEIKIKQFKDLFPDNFNQLSGIIYLIRNKTFHEFLSQKDSHDLEIIKNLIEWCFLDLLEILAVIMNFFCMVFVEAKEYDSKDYKKIRGLNLTGHSIKRIEFFINKYPNPRNKNFKNTVRGGYLYLINKEKERVEGVKTIKELLHTDYIDLTPFLIYSTLDDTKRKNTVLKIQNIYSEADKNNLFVIHNYDKEAVRIAFQQFTGNNTKEFKKEANSNGSILDLFENYETAYKKIISYLKIDEIEKIDDSILELIFVKSWELSKHHVSSLINYDLYDTKGNFKAIVNNNKDLNSVFSSKLYVIPNESAYIDEFINTNKRGLILIGKSGYGKSYLLGKYFLKFRESNIISLFLNARKLYDPNIKQYLTDRLKEIHSGLTHSKLGDILQKHNKRFIIIVDAVNEYNSIGGPIFLLEKIIELIDDLEYLKNVQIICSTRTEVWKQYLETVDKRAKILNVNNFYTKYNDGDAIPIEGFDQETKRKALYHNYQKAFNLIPENFNELNESVKQLIIQPFMMRAIADTYGNIVESKSIQKIPKKKMNFYALFNDLSDRKIKDAVRGYPDADILKLGLHKCLVHFSEILFSKITKGLKTNDTDKVDAILKHELYENTNYRKLYMDKEALKLPVSAHNLLIELRLIEEVKTPVYDYFGNNLIDLEISYKFFHDQYTQFWLSKVLAKNILFHVKSSELSDKTKLDSVTMKIRELLNNAQNSPVIIGALDHWFYNNMMHGKKHAIADYLLILFENLLDKNDDLNIELQTTKDKFEIHKESGFYHYYVGAFLNGLIEKNIVEPDKLYKEIFNFGSMKLKKCITDYFLNSVGDILQDNFDGDFYRKVFLALIESCDPDIDDELYREMGDVFSDMYVQANLQGKKRIITFFNDVFPEPTQINMVVSAALNNKFEKHLAFMMNFMIKSLISNLGSNTHNLNSIKEFFQEKYKLILESTFQDNNKIKKSKVIITLVHKEIRKRVIKSLDVSGETQWKQAIGNIKTDRKINNGYYIETEGQGSKLVQRDVLHELYPYLIHLHNQNFKELNLRITELKDLLIKSISFNDGSLIGYVAVLILGVIINNEPEEKKKDSLERFIDELLRTESAAALNFIPVLIDTLAKMNIDENQIEYRRELLNYAKIIIPKLVERSKTKIIKKESLPNIYYFVDTSSLDINDYWEEDYKGVFDVIFETIEDEQIAALFNERLIYICYFPKLDIGEKVIKYLLEKVYFNKPSWKSSILRLLAALYTRDKKRLLDLIKPYEDKISVQEIIGHLDSNIFLLRDARSYQTNWNEVFIFAFNSNKMLRYYLLRDLFSGLITTENVKDEAQEYRRFVLNALEDVLGYTDENKRNKYHLTMEDAMKLCKFTADIGGNKGEEYKG